MNKTIIANIEKRFPTYTTRYERFRKFIKEYFLFLEEEGNAQWYANNFLDNTDSSNEQALFWDKILADIGWNLEVPTNIDKSLFITAVRDYYLTRGSLKSVEFLFRIFYGEEVKITYPRDDLLIPSESSYSNKSYMFVAGEFDSAFRQLKQETENFNLYGVGVISGHTMIVDDIVKSRGFYKLTISTTDEFIPGESIRLKSNNIEVIGTNVPHFEIIPNANTTTESVPNFEYTKVTKQKGIVEQVDIIDGGTDNADDKVISNNKSGFYGKATIENGIVTSIKIMNNGYAVSEMPTILCGNATLKGKSSTIGKPKKVECLEAYLEPNETEFDVVANAVFKTIKDYENTNHLLEYDCYITDSLYYQQFSYRIESKISRPEYEPMIKKETHPVGFIVFSKLKHTFTEKLNLEFKDD